jgi:GTP-binding protein
MFIDEVEIFVRAGKGGDGVVHFRREKFIPRGGPDGGDGGKGGDLVFEVNPSLNTLYSFQHKDKFIAQDGSKGSKSNSTGKSGDNLIVYVPQGTLVFDKLSSEALGDLVDIGQRLLVCKGGRGGRGNARFANSRNQAPRMAERGEPGQEKYLRLELKLIADVGIVGVPNAGKSTFLAAVTNARPKIASYPFTTIEPNLGVASIGEDTTLVLADIPGLIEGAHLGVGLGHDFLRHIQRTRVLIHLLDGMAEDPILDFGQINSELALFDPDLVRKPQIVALNKIDLPDVRQRWAKIEAQLIQLKHQPIAVSGLSGENVRQVLFQAAKELETASKLTKAVELPVYRADADPKQFVIEKTSHGWRVRGAAIERAAAMTYWDNDASIRRFQRILEILEIDKNLRSAGIKVGDTVAIGEFELEWSD